MKQEQASAEFVREYYDNRVKRRALFPETRGFYEVQLKNVDGDRVVNVGCGPQLYDDLRHFRRAPREYIGLDLNRENISFLNESSHPELLEAKRLAEESGTKTRLICGDILDPELKLSHVDCVLSVGFLGIFVEEKFAEAVTRIGSWLRPGGRLVNLAWLGNHQERELYQGRLRYQFNHPGNPNPEDIVLWTQQNGFSLVQESLFQVPDKMAYGWAVIQACVFEKQTARS